MIFFSRKPGYPLTAIVGCLLVLTTFKPLFGTTWNFDKDVLEKPPQGWESGTTGTGAPNWVVVEEKNASSARKVLKQGGSGTFPWCVLNESNVRDGLVEVKFKALSGEEDQAGGLVWRFQNGDNYYVVRANALENNVVLYKVVAGRRTDLKPKDAGTDAYGVKADVPGNVWHKMRVIFKGQNFKVYFNDKLLFEADDSTFADAGKVGVWTKADSVSLFSDFAYESEK